MAAEKVTVGANDVGKVRIAAGVVTMAAHKDRSLAERIEAAMADAVQDCLQAGVSINDSDTIKAAMMAARERVLHPPVEPKA